MRKSNDVRRCERCMYYDKVLEFNCTRLHIITESEDAKKCDYYCMKKQRRKRCNKCMYLTYKYVPKKGKHLYICKKTGHPRAYTSLVNCNSFKKISEDVIRNNFNRF